MSRTHRIVWNEGMFLGPQHFQQWDHFVDAEIAYRQGLAVPNGWGVRRLELDRDGLANGRLSVQVLEAILPDGTSIVAPARDPLPAGRALKGRFPADLPLLEVFLALPEARPGIPLCRPDGTERAADSRFLGETTRVGDDNETGAEVEVTVARPNLKLLLTGESVDSHTVLKLAEIERAADGKLALVRDHAPPSLSLTAAGPVTEILRTILEMLTAKSSALAGQTRQRGGGMVEYGTSDVGNFWLLHTVNSFIPVLAHDLRSPDLHPETAYLHLAQLAGALCTFGVDKHPREVTAYEHDNPGPVFRALERSVRDLLQTVMPTRYTAIPLERRDEATLVGNVENEAMLQPGVQWILAVSGEMAEARVRDEVPAQVILGSPHNLEFLVRTATPGVILQHLPVPPRDFPLKAGHTYFQLDTQGETWETVRESHSLALYAGGPELRALNYELITTTR